MELFGGVSRTVKPVGRDQWLLPNIHADTLVVLGDDGTISTGPHVYEPWGNPLAGSSYPDFTANTAEYGWLGQHQKATETTHQNITQMGARPYHPGIARFLSVDPIEGGTLNDYTYVHDPINSYDLDGKGFGDFVKKAAGGVVGAVSDPVGTVSKGLSEVWEHRRGIAKVAIIVGATAGAIACGASVVCAVAVGAAAGAATYTASNAGTKNFSGTGLLKSAAIGGATGLVGVGAGKAAASSRWLAKTRTIPRTRRGVRVHFDRQVHRGIFGKRSHWQVDTWVHGVKKSDRPFRYYVWKPF